jgi:hypothetical protein
MDDEAHRHTTRIANFPGRTDPETFQYQPEQWRNQEASLDPAGPDHNVNNPNPREQSRLLELLGLINYKILSGNRVYVEVGGVVYKTLYGGYWRSVFTGIQHYLLRCEEIRSSMWAEGAGDTTVVDLPIAYSNNGWTASGHSLSFMVTRDYPAR